MKQRKVAIIKTTIFLLFSGPNFVLKSVENLMGIFETYFLHFFFSNNSIITLSASQNIFYPDAFITVTEISKLNVFEHFKVIFGNKEIE